MLSENNIVLEELQDLTDEPPPRTTRYRSLSALATNPLAVRGTKSEIFARPRNSLHIDCSYLNLDGVMY